MASKDKKSASKIRTLADLIRDSDRDSDSDSDSGNSGMIVEGPPKGNDMDEIFDKAREQGAVEGSPANFHTSSPSSFTGTGRTLTGRKIIAYVPPPESVSHKIVIWLDGFKVDDGPLRRLDDPENAPFLESIRKTECPKELQPVHSCTQVFLSVTRMEKNFPVPEPVPVKRKRTVTFQGTARTLGSSLTSNSYAKSSEETDDTSMNSAPRPSPPVLDENKPVVSVHLKLEGLRMITYLNTYHTVNDLRDFIDYYEPNASRNYQIQAGFPPKLLTDLNQTLEQAGVDNYVIQKLQE